MPTCDANPRYDSCCRLCSVPWRASGPSIRFIPSCHNYARQSNALCGPLVATMLQGLPSDRPAVPETNSEDATSAEPIFSKLHHSTPCIKRPTLPPATYHLFSTFICRFSTRITLILVPYTSLPTHHSAPCTPVALLPAQRPQSSERASGLLHELIALCSGAHRQFAYSSPSAPCKLSRRHRAMRKTFRLLVSTPARRASQCSSRKLNNSQNNPSRSRTPLSPSRAQPPAQRHPHRMCKR